MSTKIRMVDPVRSLYTKIQMRNTPRNPYFGIGGRPVNQHGIGGVLPGDPGLNPHGYLGRPDISVKAIKARYLTSIKNLRNKMQKTKPKDKGRRSPEGLKVVKEAREIQEMARRYAPDAIKAMGEILRSKVASDLAKISAANSMLDRGYGKAMQTNINATVNTDGKPSEIDEQELNRRISETIQRVEGITKRKREKIKSEDGPTDVRKLH